jgi:hypothetical protein
LFDELLQKQLVLKKVINRDEWSSIREGIKFDFNTDNHFAELKEAEIFKSRLEILQQVDSFAGKYFSQEWIRQNVLHQNEEDRREIDAQIQKEQQAVPGATQFDAESDVTTSDTDIDNVLEIYDPLADLELDN